MSIERKLLDLKKRKEAAYKGGGEARIEKQHKKGKLTARERLEILLDEGSFEEFDVLKMHRCTNFGLENNKIAGDGIVTGFGTIDGRPVYVFSQDFTVFGGSLSETFAEKIVKIMEMSAKSGIPLIGLNDSGGARIQEGIESLAGYADIFLRNVMYSGVIPQISAIMGPCAGGAVYSPAITDFIFMVKKSSYMFLTGPKVVKTVLNEDVSTENLGGASIHSTKSGIAHFVYESDEEVLLQIRRLMSFLPLNNKEKTPLKKTNDAVDRIEPMLNKIVPSDPNKPYDIKEVINLIVDDNDFLEVQPLYATNIVIGFARFNGRSVGIVANQPKSLAGTLDIASSEKAARFVRFCDSFNIPFISLVDVPGFLPGTGQEHGGIIRHGAKLLYAIAEATVPKIALIVKKSYGGAYIAMSSKALGYDRTIAYPTAEVAVMGAEGAANVIFRRDIKAAEDPAAMREQKIGEFRETVMNPFIAAGFGYLDDIIDPAETREQLWKSLEMYMNKSEDRPKKKHGNMPL
ncbi:acyl-CoA carboxylase subunit beta [candidate division WOR-3 bacterium]|nr:acyl-CoA carboxylase subunit beta [candidate division WOR-3 bacterium]